MDPDISIWRKTGHFYFALTLVANQVERACDSAGRAQKTARFRFRFFPFWLPAGVSDLHSES